RLLLARLASVYPCDLYPEWRIWLDNFATTEEIPSCGMMLACVADEKIFEYAYKSVYFSSGVRPRSPCFLNETGREGMHELRIAVLNQVLEAIGRSDGIA